MNGGQEINIQDIVKKVKHIEILAKKLVEESFSSEYHSIFKGNGIEFHEVRNYFPEDDIRFIDWNVTARMNSPYVKIFIEERELSVYFVVDVSNSSYSGNIKSLRQVMAEIVAFIGFGAFFNNDKTGLILFSDKVEKIIPAKHNYSHLLRIIRDTWYYKGVSKKTNINESLLNILSIIKKKAIIVLLSDFYDLSYEKSLIALSKKHDVIAISINEEYNKINTNQLNFYINPFKIFLNVEDLENNDTIFLDINEIRSKENTFEKYKNRVFKKSKIDYINITPSDDYFKKIELTLLKRLKHR